MEIGFDDSVRRLKSIHNLATTLTRVRRRYEAAKSTLDPFSESAIDDTTKDLIKQEKQATELVGLGFAALDAVAEGRNEQLQLTIHNLEIADEAAMKESQNLDTRTENVVTHHA